MHQFGFHYTIISRCTVNRTQNVKDCVAKHLTCNTNICTGEQIKAWNEFQTKPTFDLYIFYFYTCINVINFLFLFTLKQNALYEGRSEINASYFIMLAHDVRGEYC